MNWSPLARTPVIRSPLKVTWETEPSLTWARNAEYGTSCTALVRVLKLLTTVASTTAITIHRTTFLARSFNALTSVPDAAIPGPERPISRSRHYTNRYPRARTYTSGLRDRDAFGLRSFTVS